MFHRYFVSRVDKLVVGMEEQALWLIEVMQGEREAGDRALP
jgi:biopolymer transport protein ExbB